MIGLEQRDLCPATVGEESCIARRSGPAFKREMSVLRSLAIGHTVCGTRIHNRPDAASHGQSTPKKGNPWRQMTPGICCNRHTTRNSRLLRALDPVVSAGIGQNLAYKRAYVTR